MKIICMGDSLTEGDYGLPGQSGIPEKPLVHFMDHGFVSSFLGTENGTAALLTAEGVGDITGNPEGTVL